MRTPNTSKPHAPRATHDLDIDRIRRDTPACENLIHMHSSGSSLMPQCVLDAVTSHLHLETQRGGYEALDIAFDARNAVYESIAALVSAKVHNIALTESATISWTRVFTALAKDFKPGDKILTAQAEYASNYIAYMQAAAQFGVHVEVVPDDGAGQLDVNALERMIDSRVKLIAITHIPTNGGLVNPAREVGEICRSANIPYLLDACQSVGQMPLDVEALGCDFLSATGRKFLRGPRGTGFLYISDRMLEVLEPWPLDLYAANWNSTHTFTMREDARRFEFFESSVANQLGLGVAVDYALALGMDVIWQRICTLASSLRQQLADVPGVTLRDKGLIKCGIVSFTCTGLEPHRIQRVLRDRNINIGVTDVQSTRLDFEHRQIDTCFRPSVHYFNTQEEIDRFVAQMQNLSPSCVTLS